MMSAAFFVGLTAMVTAKAAQPPPGATSGEMAATELLFGTPNPRETPPVRNFLSATLGSNMVLQRAPQQAVIWGFAAVGSMVTATLDGTALPPVNADATSTWRVALPATPASSTKHTIQVKASTGQEAVMSNVLFGDVYICSGQSNMQFSMPAIENATEEIALADKYPLIRTFTVGQKTSSTTPLDDLQTIEQGWAVANSTSIAGGGRFGYMSAVCWIFGREVFDGLEGKVPIGLVSNNWGGTPVEHWTTPEALQACEPGKVDSTLYNSMIHPYVVGPMTLTGFTWYQGEANTQSAASAEMYACTFPGMISAWRSVFKQPEAYFGFIQLSTWCGNGEAIADMREAQMAALKLPKVGYGTNADHGAGCNIHPPPKQYCGKRLADSALALQYGQALPWQSPSFASQKASASPPSVTVSFNDYSPAGFSSDTYPFNYLGVGPTGAPVFNCTENDAKSPGTCAWAALQLADGTWVNATVTVDQYTVILTAPPGAPAGLPLASSYAWGAVPMMSLYDKWNGLPVLPWKKNVTST